MTRELIFRKFVVSLQYPLSSRISSSIYTKGWVKLNFSKTLSAQKPSWLCYTRTCSNHSQDSVDEFIHPVLKCPCDVTSLSFNFSDPYIQKEALQTPVIVHWSVSRQMTPRHLCVSSERLIFLDTIGSTVLHRLVNRRKKSQKSKSCIVSWNENYWTGNFEEKHLSHMN